MPSVAGRKLPGMVDIEERRRTYRSRSWLTVVWVTLLVGGLTLAGAGGAQANAGPLEVADVSTTWVWPLQPQPQVVHGFDSPDRPWQPGHRGVDLLGRAGQQVHAAGTGTVVYAGMLAGRGVVSVDHGALRTTYEPVSATVHVGEHVRAGQAIGQLALIGGHCLPRACLHWGLLRGDTYMDPLSLVGAGPVRLLPLPAGPRQSAVVAGAGPVGSAPGAVDDQADPPTPDAVPPRLARTRAVGGAPWLVVGVAGAALGGTAWMLAWARRR